MPVTIPLITTTLSVRPELARKVIWGLRTREYERVGGVIRRADNKRIVTWLRNVEDSLPTGWSPVADLGPLVQLNAATSLLNLSVTAVGFAMVMRRLDTIETKLNAILGTLQEINRKLDLNFYANFRAALELARSAFAMQDERNRRVGATQAINRFLEAEQHYTSLLDMELEAGSLAVSSFLSTLILAYVSVGRCYLELGESRTARRHLQEGSQTLASRVQEFYTSVIGVNPAIYLHPDLAGSISLERMTQLLRYEDPDLTVAGVFEKLRGALWETASRSPASWVDNLPESLWRPSVDGEKRTGPIKRSRSQEEMFSRLLPRLPEAFAQVEQAVESASCVNGFQIELGYLIEHGISFDEWRQIELPPFTQDDPIVWMIPRESELLSLG